jgi:DNA-binding CsgD family transcriptional regulator
MPSAPCSRSARLYYERCNRRGTDGCYSASFEREDYVSKKISSLVLEAFSGGSSASSACLSIEQLSDREFQVFELIGLGLSTAKIARRLSLSAKTVDAHRAQIKKKLHIKSASELISFAARWLTSRGGKQRTMHSPNE